METRSTRLRVSSVKFLFNYTQIILFLRSHHFGKCSYLIFILRGSRPPPIPTRIDAYATCLNNCGRFLVLTALFVCLQKVALQGLISMGLKVRSHQVKVVRFYYGPKSNSQVD